MEMKTKHCPCCGRKVDPEDEDTLHRSGKWKDSNNGFRRYMPSSAEDFHGWTWSLSCVEHYGGCGLNISGDSKEEVIEKWNRRVLSD